MPRRPFAGWAGGDRAGRAVIVAGVTAAVALAVFVVASLAVLVAHPEVFYATAPGAPSPSAPGGPGQDPSGHGPGSESPTVGGFALETVVARLDTLVPEALGREGVPGASVAVIGDGRLLWAKGYGLANKATGEAVTDETVFRGASFSKTMTAYVALKMVETGVLELDRPLFDYAGEAYLADRRIKDVTLRMVLTHTSGFTDMSRDRGGIAITPGECWSYSSDAFRYLQWVIERVTGEPFDQYAADHLFAPLGLEATSFLWRDEYATLAARGYEPEGAVAQVRPVRANAAYGVLTTPTDFARLVVAIMNPVEGDPDRLSRATVEAMLTPQVEAAEGVSWGLGWGLERSPDVDCFWHWGWLDGFRNLAVADRDRRAAVVVMTNGAGGLRVAEEIVRAILPGEHPVFPSLIDFWE